VTSTTSEGVPLSDVSRLLGVPMPTLRSWELRYGIPETSREPGKHRRYQSADLHAMRLMRDEIARGKRASLAAQSVRALLGLDGAAAPHITAFLKASASSDPVAIRAELDSAQSALGLGGCIDDVLFPAMQQIGTWWQTGRCDIEQERLTTETARAWLEARAAFAPTPTHSEALILACGPSDLHTIGLEALAVLLRYQHRSCRILGARTPVVALTTAVQATKVPAVVIVSHLSTGRHRAVQSLRAVHELGAVVFYAGNAFTAPNNRRGIPGTYLGTRLTQACSTIVDTLGPA
jgi:DNA-binding transcriptional MerR regulator